MFYTPYICGHIYFDKKKKKRPSRISAPYSFNQVYGIIWQHPSLANKIYISSQIWGLEARVMWYIRF